MATASSLGVGTGIDLQSMLTSILTAERAPITAANSKITATNTKISLYGTLKSKLDSLQTASDTLRFPSRLAAVSASTSDSKIATATAAFNATPGSYALDVKQLASAQKSFSNSYANGTTFGTGGNSQLIFTVSGVATPAIDIADGSTLQQVSAAINTAKIGVTATVISSDGGVQRMILTGDKSGSGNDFSLVSTATASNGNPLDTFDSATSLPSTTAGDALMTIDSLPVTSKTNTFTSSVEGLTFTATKEGQVSITVQSDSSTITAAVQAFVDSYNAAMTTIKSNSGYDTAKKTGQAFSGDFAARSVVDTLSSARTTVPSTLSSATFKTLSELGVTIQQSGLLSLDSAKLSKSLSTSASEVVRTLNAYGEAFSVKVLEMQGSGGVVSTRLNSLNATVQRDKDKIAALEVRVSMIERRYRAQFTALDKYMSAMQTTSSGLSQQLATLTAGK
jgi:flagellar hook-associated protein 2